MLHKKPFTSTREVIDHLKKKLEDSDVKNILVCLRMTSVIPEDDMLRIAQGDATVLYWYERQLTEADFVRWVNKTIRPQGVQA